MKNVANFLFMFCALHTFAQPYVSGGNTRHRFAQINFGADVRLFPGANTSASVLNENMQVIASPMPNNTEMRAIIGGTHFWGHSDFFVAFSVADFGKSGFKTGVETGAKIFPWRITHKKLRPYIGASWQTSTYQQGDGAAISQHFWPITAGLYYNHNSHIFELGTGFIANNQIDYYISKQVRATTTLPNMWLGIGYKFMMDGTLSAEKDWLSGRTKRLTDTLAALGRLNGFTIAVGPSTASFLAESPNNTDMHPYLGQHKFVNLFFDFGLGYYLHKPDVHFNLAWRQNKSEQQAYGTTQTLRRKALTLEGYKFLFDYHGFVPFVGPSISYEWLYAEQNNGSNKYQGQFDGVKPGLTFGWDIRPNRLQAWYLRTNLRWIPNLNVAMSNGGTMQLTQLEFNFIQLVIFPERMF